MNVGEKLFKLRRQKGLSQEELAEKLNVTRQTVSKWETNQSTPDFDKIKPLCTLYGISSDELLGTTEYKDNIFVDSELKKRKSRAIVISISVFLYFMAIISVLLNIEVFHANEVLSICIFMGICAVATIILIYHFICYPAEKTAEKRKKLIKNKKYSRIISIVSILFTIIYLIISFSTMAWHITWIIWLIYAITEEIIKLIFNVEEGENE
jgi:Predicted transcription factor, homolog of eukaryotic MBF1